MKSTLIIAFLLLAVQGFGQDPLQEYLKLAGQNDPHLKSSYYAYLSALQRVSEAKSGLPDPEVSFAYFISPVETRVGPQRAIIGLKQMFPWTGTLNAKSEAAAHNAKAKYFDFRNERAVLFAHVSELYFELYYRQKAIDITVDHLELLEIYRSITEEKFSSGDAGLVDVLRVEMEQAELDNKKAFLSDELIPLRSEVNRSLGRGLYEEILFEDSIGVVDLEIPKNALTDSVLQRNDALKTFEFRRAAVRSEEVAAKKEGAPDIGLGLNYIIVDERSDVKIGDNGKDAFIAGITVKVPLYRSRYKSKIERAHIDLLMIDQLEADAKDQMLIQMEEEWKNMLDAERRAALYRDQIGRAERIRNILLEQYSRGGQELEEVIRIQRTLLEQELELVRAQMDKNKAVARIKALYGWDNEVLTEQ